MKRKDLVRCIVDALREDGVKKHVHVPSHKLYISDDNGVSKAFTVRGADRAILFTSEDIEAFLDTAIRVVVDTLARGDNITIKGFGSLGLQYRKPRATKHVGTGEDIVIEGRYVPKFIWGNDLRAAARRFENYLEDNAPEEIVDKSDMFDDEVDFDDEDDSDVIADGGEEWSDVD